jgi:hypothetical protein
MKKLVCIGLLIALLVSCSGKTETTNVVAADGSQYSVVKNSEGDSHDSNISFYRGNELSKIYYFHYYGDTFGKKLSWFRENHNYGDTFGKKLSWFREDHKDLQRYRQ